MKQRIALLAAAAFVAACTDQAPVAPAPAPVAPPSFAVAASAPPLVINEIQADPSAVSDDAGEWFELYNTTSSGISLLNHTIVSGSETHKITTSVSVPAKGYVVLGRQSKNNGGVTLAYVYGTSITLANAGDVLVLRNASGVTVDSVRWSGTDAGVSRGVRNAAEDNADAHGGNWTPQTAVYGKGDKGTPNKQNDGWVDPNAPVAATVTVTPSSASDTIGATEQFTATAKDAAGATVATTFTWSTSNAAVATVSASGLASAVAAGSATITATSANGVAGAASYTVTVPPTDTTTPPPPTGGSELTVTVLDIGQGDATLIRNGTSTVLIDGGPTLTRFGALLDSLGLNGTTIDVAVLSHGHLDHYNGFREMMKSSRNIRVRYFVENGDATTNTTLIELRDTVAARVQRGETILRDADDPCGTGAAVCTFTLDGGAKLHVLRPNPNGSTANNRSVVAKLVGPDSASFSMWFAGDAEHEAQDWFDAAGYDVNPGMKVNVLKANHHGSCNGVKSRYVDLTNPDWVTFSVGATNSYGHVHNQTKDLFTRYAKPWLRTDVNGSVTIRSAGTAGSGYTISGQKGQSSQNGAPDGTSASSACTSL